MGSLDFVRMSLNCKLNGGMLANNKPNMRKVGWRRKRLVFFLWGLVFVIGFGLFLFNGVLRKNIEVVRRCEEDKGLVLVEHFNVSNEVLHELASSFFESDQVLLFCIFFLLFDLCILSNCYFS